MPVRSLSSSILRWPDRSTVESAVRAWAGEQARIRPELIRLGFFGSYATGAWGVGSDLDLVAVVAFATRPFGERALGWDLTELPVPAEILVYTGPEWARVLQNQNRFARVMSNEVVWVIEGPG